MLSSEFPPQPGGIGNHAYNLALQLQANEYNVTIIADNRSEDGQQETQFDASLPFKTVRVVRYKFLMATYLKRVWLYLKLAKKHSVIIATGKFPLWLVGMDFLIPRKKKVAIVHGTELNLKGVKRNLTNSALNRFYKIIAVSNYTKSLMNHLKLQNIEVIYNGFNSEAETKSERVNLDDPTHLQLITIGNVSERKGQLNVIKAIPKLVQKYPKLHYHIVGIPTNQKEFESYAAALGIQNHITFYGKVTAIKKQKLLAQSHIFLMLSNATKSGDVEGFGIAIIEANAAGLPAVGSKNCGIEDAIKNNYSGKLVNPLDAPEVSLAITEIVRNYDTYANQAMEWSKNFKWEKVIIKYLKVLST
jgi:glycosyltransferase involved in cell wall biosynthesis